MGDKFYLVREDALPESMKKVLEAKELIERKKAKSVADAVQKVDVSRSVFYKYRDAVFPFNTIVKEKIITLFFHLEDRSGTLSQLLKLVSAAKCNILTIHQTIPVHGKANVTLSLDTAGMTEEINTLLSKLNRLEFVLNVEVLSSGA
ncbi:MULTISPECIES: ACT domain-containing protein [Bacillaceae]|uniref:ACT domain-containing protein n=1 Tax=Bacillaceae TaxID=186817 RepID=UPI002A0C9676|nr:MULTISPECIES: ACT domain-containing protein [unclassified Cytobacillus]MDX8359429.1 ACT domain-containing protein [Cytobacillus sp. IB215316]MDX8364065.1 ACT domain-containing protein [Cytobacillus sp. IB215665]